MFQVRFHGRGGQGTVTAAELLSSAAFCEGKFAQAFPSFGPERTGAPISAFCRIDARPIRTHEPVVAPDALVIADASLLRVPRLTEGLVAGGLVIINTTQTMRVDGAEVCTVRASELAQRLLGKPLPHAALLATLLARTRVVGFEALARAITDRFEGPSRDGNIAVARAAWKEAEPC